MGAEGFWQPKRKDGAGRAAELPQFRILYPFSLRIPDNKSVGLRFVTLRVSLDEPWETFGQTTLEIAGLESFGPAGYI
jgi:hypothetical protein